MATLDIHLKDLVTVKRDILLMTIVEVNGHVVRDTEFGDFFQVIGDDDVAVFFKSNKTQQYLVVA